MSRTRSSSAALAPARLAPTMTKRLLAHRVLPPVRLRNSSLVRGSSRTSPCSAEVTVLAPGFCSPGNDMHGCSAARLSQVTLS